MTMLEQVDLNCLVPRPRVSEINKNDVRKHICEAIFSDLSDLIRDRRADTLFHLARQSASNDYQYTDIAVTAC